MKTKKKAKVRVLQLARSCFKKVAKWLIATTKEYRHKRLVAASDSRGNGRRHTGGKRKCKAIAKSTGRLCGNSALNGSHYCHCHQRKSFKSLTNFASRVARCTAKIVLESFSRGGSVPRKFQDSLQRSPEGPRPRPHAQHKAICHTSHVRTKAADFRLPNLHKTKAVAVWNYREQKDAYTGFTRYQMKGLPIDLDHVLELHVARDAFDRIQTTGVRRRKKIAVAKERFVNLLNQPFNLNATTSEINQIKFRGVYGFQRDYHLGIGSDTGLVHYLEAANYKSKRLSRKTTACIQSEIVRSYDSLSNNLREEDGIESQMLDLLHDNLTAMRLF